jgi:putative ABC transport system ATP-binding protein
MSNLIRLSNLRKSYRLGHRKLEVLKGIDLEIGTGEFVAIMGSSGSGKSTLLNVLGILDDYDDGLYELNGIPIKNLSPRKAARYRNEFIGFVFQSFNLLPFKNAVENVALPLYYKGVKRKERNALALDLLDRVGLKAWAEHLPSELSGGQNQRVAIARSLAAKPKMVLADEPTGALDTATSQEIMNLFDELNNEGITVIVVTHEDDIADRAGRLIRLKDGLIEKSPQHV